MKLIKFRGRDYGKVKLTEKEQEVEQIEFPDKTTLKSIFTPIVDSEGNSSHLTQSGELVFMRSVLDFSNKIKGPGEKKDEVLEENLLDVKRLLKNSNASKQP